MRGAGHASADPATNFAAERRQAFLDQEDRNAQGTPVDAGDRQFNELRNSVSLSAVIRAQLRDTSNTAEAGRVRELSQEVARRSGRSPANVKPEARGRIRANWEANQAGRQNAGKIVYAEPGQAFTPMSSTPEDAEVLESRKFGVIEACRLFKVPPPIIQDYSYATFTNASQASIWFAQNTLSPWARKLEAEFSRSVFSDPAYHIEVDLSGLVRGDYVSRWTATSRP